MAASIMAMVPAACRLVMSTSSVDSTCMAFFTVLGMSCSFRSRKILCPAGLDLPHDGRALRVEQLHANLHERLFLLEQVQESFIVFSRFSKSKAIITSCAIIQPPNFWFGGDAREAASLREAPPSRSLPKSGWRLAGYVSSGLDPPESWARFPAGWMRSRRLTEPPRPCR